MSRSTDIRNVVLDNCRLGSRVVDVRVAVALDGEAEALELDELVDVHDLELPRPRRWPHARFAPIHFVGTKNVASNPTSRSTGTACSSTFR